MRSLLISLLAAPLITMAQTITVEPGELAASKSLPTSGSRVTILGSINAADLDYIATAANGIATLDLSGAKVVAYQGERVGASTFSAPANAIPAYILSGLKAGKLLLPATVTTIGDGALMGSTITEVAIPAGVTAIGQAAFSMCSSLKSVTIPSRVTVIAPRVFEGCEGLAGVNMSSDVTTIGQRAFMGCQSLESFNYPAALRTIGAEAFASTGIESADMGHCENLASVGDRAFAGDIHLTTAILPAEATLSGSGIFFHCPSLQSVKLPATATALPPLTLKGAESLTSVELPDDIETIGQLSLAGAGSVEHVTLPASLTHIGSHAFENWESLSTIDGTALTEVPSLGDDVWRGINKTRVVLDVASGLVNDFLATPQWQEFDLLQSETTEITGEIGKARITVAFEGMTLLVTSDISLKSVTVYSLDGLSLNNANAISDRAVAIDTSRLSGSVFIVKVATADDSAPSLGFKLLRP